MPARPPLHRSASNLPAQVRRFVRTMVLMMMGALLAAPLALGSATGAVLHLLGSQAAHRCACGMVPGTCGCAECKLLERQAREDDRDAMADSDMTRCRVKSSCDGEDGMPSFAPLPPAVPLDAHAMPSLAPPHRVAVLAMRSSPPLRLRGAPELPPPRA